MIRASGNLRDQPIALVYGALARSFATGMLRVEQESTAVAVWWRDGAIVDGDSAVPEDQPGRVALDEGLTSAQAIGESLRWMALHPGHRHIDVLAEMGALDPPALAKLKRLCLVRRSMRPFGLPAATYAFERTSHERSEGGPLDAGWVIYRAIRRHHDEARLDRELGLLAGKAMRLVGSLDEVQRDLAFTDEELTLVAYLAKGYWELADLENACVNLARPVVLAVVLALAAIGRLDLQHSESVPRLRRRSREMSFGRRRDDAQAVASPAPAGGSTPAVSKPAERSSDQPGSGGTMEPPRPPTKRPASKGTGRARAGSPSTLPPGAAADPAVTARLREQIGAKLAQVDSDVDHFALLEVDQQAGHDKIRAAYFQLAKTYHPDRLALVRLEDLRPQVEHIFAALSHAFAVIGGDEQRMEYLDVLARGGEAAVRRRDNDEAERAARILAAEESFRRGEMALRRQMFPQAAEEFKRALEHNPDEPEHHALYAWATWCAATDKKQALPEVRRALGRALELAPELAVAHYYLGQVHKHGGDIDRAAAHFQKALSIKPGLVDAERELRILEMRRQRGAFSGGLFDQFKKK